MEIEREFPLRFFINLGRREDRRFAVAEEFARIGLGVRRFPAVDGRWVRSARGFSSKGRYALALTQRLIVRGAWQAGAPAVLLFEDDVVFARGFREKVAGLVLPDDWRIFFFGCLHMAQPEPLGGGLVRVRRAYANHAMAIRAPAYRRVLAALRPKGRGEDGRWRHTEPCDVLTANLHRELPTYAAYPNLAWQPEVLSDLTGFRYAHFGDDGRQLFQPEHVRPLEGNA